MRDIFDSILSFSAQLGVDKIVFTVFLFIERML